MTNLFRSFILIASTLLLASPRAQAQKFTVLADTAGIEAAYRWSIPRSGTPELLLRLSNNSKEARTLHLTMDITNDLLTIEELRVDTCIRGGQVLNGKLNGFWFAPEGVDRKDLERGAIGVTRTTLTLTPAARCGGRTTDGE